MAGEESLHREQCPQVVRALRCAVTLLIPQSLADNLQNILICKC